MEKIKEKKDKSTKFLAFLLGIIVCNNVAYAFKVGNTYINVAYIYGVIVFCYLFFYRKENLRENIKNINNYFKIFIFITIISIIPLILTFATNISSIMVYFKGILVFCTYIILYIDVISLSNFKNIIIKGLAYGFVFNIALSLIQYITYINGNYFSLYYIFPQPAFQINSYFGVTNFLQQSEDTFNIYAYRAQGFFLETSYYFAFMAGVSVVLFVKCKKGIVKLLSVISVIFILLMTSSGNMIIIFFTFLIYYIMKKIKTVKNENKKINIKTLIFIMTIILIVLLMLYTNIFSFTNFISENNIYNRIINNIKSANLTSEDNSERLENMIFAFKLIKKYPLGVGYNMSPTILNLEDEGNTLLNNTTFNSLITILLEEGPVGMIVYIMYIYMISINLIMKAKNKYRLALGCSVLGIIICQIGNGIGFFPFVLLIFALANIEINEMKEENKNDTRIRK